MKLSIDSKYYGITIPVGILIWFGCSLINISFINIIFCMMAYIWHFSLLAPNVKEKVLKKGNRFSLLSIVFQTNYYLQMFISYPKNKIRSSLVRAISPLIFTFVLYFFGGSGNLIFTLIGSLIFESMYSLVLKKIISNDKDILKTVQEC